MAWSQPGDKPLSEPMMICLLMHICITQPQWVKGWVPSHCDFSTIIQIWWKICCFAQIHFRMDCQIARKFCTCLNSHAILEYAKFVVIGPVFINTLRPRQNSILHMTFSNALSSMKILEFWLNITNVVPKSPINPLRPSDAKWWQWSWTTLAHVMACCLMAPSHYLNQCWLIIRGVMWHSSVNSFAGIAQDINSGYQFEKDILKISFKSPRGQWVNNKPSLDQIMNGPDQTASHYINQWWHSWYIYVTWPQWVNPSAMTNFIKLGIWSKFWQYDEH